MTPPKDIQHKGEAPGVIRCSAWLADWSELAKSSIKEGQNTLRISLRVESRQSKVMADERRASNPKPTENKMNITVNHSLNKPSAKVAAQINDFEPVNATWSADFDLDEQSCWDAAPVLESELGKVFGVPVKVQLFHSNGHAITDNSNEVTYGSMLVTRK